ncbi:MAG: tetratricopeptide repeat protein [Synechococcales bacterium]|nr:tetratricopeptide repeat protein [Synechococcales bacterium]
MYDLPASSHLSCREHLASRQGWAFRDASPCRTSLNLVEAGQYEEALAHLDWAIRLDADDYEAWTLRGIVLVCLGRYQEALASCDAALALRPNHVEAWQFRGIALHGLNRYREAYASYNRALGQPQEAIAQRFIRWLREWWSPRADASPIEEAK